MLKTIFLTLLLSFFFSCETENNEISTPEKPETAFAAIPFVNIFKSDTSARIKEKLASMTLRGKIAQMIVSSTIPENFDENSPDFRKLKKLCTETKVGGFIFFKGSCTDYARLSNKLQELSETPLLISSDFERGTGMRITDGNLYPNNMAIGATGNYKLPFEMGKLIAQESRLLGVVQDYAPVCDVNNNPNNPIINVRSFGEDPGLVSKMSEAEIKGLQDGMVIATSKHFPGHGDTEIDSHSDLPVLNFSMDRLNSIELVPFKNAIDKNVMSVMIAHLSFPVLESKDHIPASLSNSIVSGLLIGQLGFKGLIVTDALNMKGITKYFSTSEVAVMCVNAGIDLILMPLDEEKSISAIEKEVKSGAISEDRINTSVEKILKAKEWAGLFDNRFVSSDDAYKLTHTGDADKLAQMIADESITLVKDDNNIIPFKGNVNKVLVVNLSDGKENINSDYLSEASLKIFPGAKILDITSSNISAEYSTILDNAGNFDCVIIGIFAKIKFGTGKISILPEQIDVLNSIISKNKNTAVISFGNPYLLKEFPSIPNYICAYGDASVSINAAISAVTGKTKIGGKLPVSINETYKFGTGLTR